MKFGIADYGMNVWYGARFDTEQRLAALREIGYEGLEGLVAVSGDDLLYQAAIFRRLEMDFATCDGPSPEVSIRWTAALGKSYVWTASSAAEFDVFCRQANHHEEICRRWGIRVGLHNHLGTAVETQVQLEDFLARCPGVSLILDTAHLAAAGGDPVEIVNSHARRIATVHLKDWMTTDPDVGLDDWPRRGRFCELGAGNIGLDNAAVMRALSEKGYDGWIFVEHDTHLQDPFKDLAVSRQYLRDAGF